MLILTLLPRELGLCFPKLDELAPNSPPKSLRPCSAIVVARMSPTAVSATPVLVLVARTTRFSRVMETQCTFSSEGYSTGQSKRYIFVSEFVRSGPNVIPPTHLIPVKIYNFWIFSTRILTHFFKSVHWRPCWSQQYPQNIWLRWKRQHYIRRRKKEEMITFKYILWE